MRFSLILRDFFDIETSQGREEILYDRSVNLEREVEVRSAPVPTRRDIGQRQGVNEIPHDTPAPVRR